MSLYKQLKNQGAGILLLLCLMAIPSGCTRNGSAPDTTIVERIDISDIRAGEIPSLFASEKVKYNSVSVLNWPDLYPYCPQVDFAVAHNGGNLLIHYRVTEKRTIGTMENDLDDVYKESCCEFFCMEEGDGKYYNIEANCIGSILMGHGEGRKGREISAPENLSRIDRWASLGRKSVGFIGSETHWELALVVPVETFWNNSFETLSGRTFRVNVYNCIENGDDRQYVTWHPVDTPAPDFHRPEFFRPILFK